MVARDRGAVTPSCACPTPGPVTSDVDQRARGSDSSVAWDRRGESRRRGAPPKRRASPRGARGGVPRRRSDRVPGPTVTRTKSSHNWACTSTRTALPRLLWWPCLLAPTSNRSRSHTPSGRLGILVSKPCSAARRERSRERGAPREHSAPAPSEPRVPERAGSATLVGALPLARHSVARWAAGAAARLRIDLRCAAAASQVRVRLEPSMRNLLLRTLPRAPSSSFDWPCTVLSPPPKTAIRRNICAYSGLCRRPYL